MPETGRARVSVGGRAGLRRSDHPRIRLPLRGTRGSRERGPLAQRRPARPLGPGQATSGRAFARIQRTLPTAGRCPTDRPLTPEDGSTARQAAESAGRDSSRRQPGEGCGSQRQTPRPGSDLARRAREGILCPAGLVAGVASRGQRPVFSLAADLRRRPRDARSEFPERTPSPTNQPLW
jgi:hypothetical protein